MVVVNGEPGAGKTSLIQEFVDAAGADGAGAVGRVRSAVHAPPARPAARRRPPPRRRRTRRAGDAAQSARDLRRRVRAPPPAPVAARGRRPPLGRPGHRRPAALPAAAHRCHPQLVVVAAARRGARPSTTRCGRCSATSPARPMPIVDGAAAAEPWRRSPTLVDGPAGRRRPHRAAHRRQPVLRHRDARPRTATTCRPRSATRSSPAPPTSTPRRGTSLHLLACAPEAIPDHLLAGLRHRAAAAAGARPGRADPARRSRASRSATTCAGWPSPRTIPPGGEVGAAPAHARRARGDAGADPAVLTHHAVGAGDPRPGAALRHRGRPRSRLGPAPARQAAAFCWHWRSISGALAPVERQAELLEWLADGVLPDRPARRRHRRVASGRWSCASGPATRRASATNHHALVRVPLVQRRPRRRRAARRPRRSRVLDGDDAGRPEPCPLGHALRDAGAPGPPHAATSTTPRRLISTAPASARAAGDPIADRADRADRRHLPDGLRRRVAAATRCCRSSAAPDDELRRDLLERLEQPHLPRRRAAAAAGGRRRCSTSACR